MSINTHQNRSGANWMVLATACRHGGIEEAAGDRIVVGAVPEHVVEKRQGWPFMSANDAPTLLRCVSAGSGSLIARSDLVTEVWKGDLEQCG
jgi:hypothetical protein